MQQNPKKVVATIIPADIEPCQDAITSHVPHELLCTYNWKSDPQPSIYVPGAPSRWVSPSLPCDIEKDTPISRKEQEMRPVAQFHFEPMCQALSIMKPGFNFEGVDLITNRNNLRKLFDFIGNKRPKAFRIDLDIIHNTLLMTRREKYDKELSCGSRCAGYGRNFESACSKHPLDIVDSTSHHRVISYKLGPFKCVVRSETDAYQSNDDGIQASVQDNIEVPTADFATRSPCIAPNTHNQTRVIRGGTLVPCALTMEIKTQARGKKRDDFMPQLWFGRTPIVQIAYQKNGKFYAVHRSEPGTEFEKWEIDHQGSLQKLLGLIRLLRDITYQAGTPCTLVYQPSQSSTNLQVWLRHDQKSVLPESLIQGYWKTDEQVLRF